MVKHIGSAHDQDECATLLAKAEAYAEAHRAQPSLFAAQPQATRLLSLDHARLLGVTHQFARRVLLACAKRCGLGFLHDLYLDLALMRIVEPASKLRTLELLTLYFDVQYSERSAYRLLPQLLGWQAQIEGAALRIAREDLRDSFSIVLYDVTTLYFESFKDYDLQRPGFSKDNKSQQPQIVVGLITTRSGFPVMHQVFEGNTFEGHTMLQILSRFEQHVGTDSKPVIVADAAMLSKANMQSLQEHGYRYIVGARLANTGQSFIDLISAELPRVDRATRRFQYPYAGQAVSVVCEFSRARHKKDKRELDKQVARALALVNRNEPGRRAKFVKKSASKDQFEFDALLKAKTEKLLGIKGFVTNISREDLPDDQVVAYYHDLWHVEQAFRMSKSDLRTRPIFHRRQDAITAHVLICFIGLMLGKYLEIKAGQSLRKIRDALWRIHEAKIRDGRTGHVHVLRMQPDSPAVEALIESLQLENAY